MFINFSRADARNIAATRSFARRRYLHVGKSRAPLGPENLGGLRITDARGRVIAGQDFDLTIREARMYLRDYPTPEA